MVTGPERQPIRASTQCPCVAGVPGPDDLKIMALSLSVRTKKCEASLLEGCHFLQVRNCLYIFTQTNLLVQYPTSTSKEKKSPETCGI